MKKKDTQNDIIIYQAKSGAIELRGDFTKDTIWATQAQIAEVFAIERTVATKHINNILKSNEIDEKSNVQKMHIANSDKPVAFYSLDLILAVGYRANSAKAIEFRKWATKTLRVHIVDGYTINRSRIAKNYDAFLTAVSDVKALLPAGIQIDTKDVLELVRLFADTWMSLDAYDKETLDIKKPTKKKVALTAEKLTKSVAVLKDELIKKGEATELFAAERTSDALKGIVGNVMQSFGGADLYQSVEEKAVHLLYFVIKNHPFIDGNKRTGAYSFARTHLQNNRVRLTRQIRDENPKIHPRTMLVAW
jgi:prophage maintenance system killer protein/prophage antirepressor-like protein